jgi:hypothetical protein
MASRVQQLVIVITQLRLLLQREQLANIEWRASDSSSARVMVLQQMLPVPK